MGRPSGKDMTGHGDRVLDVRCVDPEIGDQCLGEALHREFRRTVCGVQNARPDRCPETVGAARVDDVALGIGRKAR
jgi:hypothetical protein